MTLEAWLAYAHILAFLGLAVFLTSEAALCRAEWLNGAVVERLVRVDAIYLLALLLTLGSGLARVQWGAKGPDFLWVQPLLHLKLALFLLMAALAIAPARAFRRWRRDWRRAGVLPPAEQVAWVRRRVMLQAHLMPLVPLAAVFLARGVQPWPLPG